MKTLAILGSTGSVGSQTLRVLKRRPDCYRVRLLAAGSNWQLLAKQIEVFQPALAVLADESSAARLKKQVPGSGTEILAGEQALLAALAADPCDLVVAAMVGQAGLNPVVAAIRAGSNIALANKEVLVMAGSLIVDLCREKGVSLLPLDSEHSAIFQCLAGQSSRDVKRLLLTASGGPFYGKSRTELAAVTAAEALKHPTWRMGAKISVDSATLMNKGLEIIEASWLFGVKPENIQVLVHRQSIIHSLVEFVDGAVLAQMGVPSMELPIQLALSWPRRWPGPPEHFLDWFELGQLDFVPPSSVDFPCLGLARAAIARGGNAPAVLSAANDICVEYFLAGKLGFNDIPNVIEQALARISWQPTPDLAAIADTAAETAAFVKGIITSLE